jgi:hypothetical protein
MITITKEETKAAVQRYKLKKKELNPLQSPFMVLKTFVIHFPP